MCCNLVCRIELTTTKVVVDTGGLAMNEDYRTVIGMVIAAVMFWVAAGIAVTALG